MLRDKISVKFSNGVSESYENVDKLRLDFNSESIKFSYVEGGVSEEVVIELSQLANRTTKKIDESMIQSLNSYLDSTPRLTNLNESLKKAIRKLSREKEIAEPESKVTQPVLPGFEGA